MIFPPGEIVWGQPTFSLKPISEALIGQTRSQFEVCKMRNPQEKASICFNAITRLKSIQSLSVPAALAIPLTRYLELLDWTGRQIVDKKRGSIPVQLASILERLGIETSGWCKLIRGFGRLFKRASGSAISIYQEAERRDQAWMQAPGVSLLS